MKVFVNKQELTVQENCTVKMLLEKKCIDCHAAVWINDKQILLKDYSSKKLNNNDNIKILRILGGG